MKIVIDSARVEDVMTVGDLLDLQSGNFQATINAMAKFCVGDDGQYMTHEEGVKAIRAMKMKDLKALTDGFSSKLTEELVPKANGADLETQ